MKSHVYIMIGIAGSGKSTCAQQLAEEKGAEIFSSDETRKEIFGDEECQENPGKIFQIMYRRARYEASIGCPVIIDATNLTPKLRRKAINAFHGLDVDFHAIVVPVDVEKAKAQNASRRRNVPEWVIERQAKQFVYPTLGEGFIDIKEV